MTLRISLSRWIAILVAISAGLIISDFELRGLARVRISDLFLLLAAILVIAHMIKGARGNGILPIMLMLCAYSAYVFLNGYVLSSKGGAIKDTLQQAFYLLGFLGLTLALREAQRFRTFALVYLVTLWAVALYCAVYHVAVLHMISGWKQLGDQKLAFGLLVTVTLALLHPRFLAGRKHWLIFVAGLLLMLLSGERKGWFAAMAGCLAILLVAPHGRFSRGSLRRLAFAAIGFVILLAALSVIAPLFPYLNRQLASVGSLVLEMLGSESAGVYSKSNEHRLEILQAGYLMFQDNPWFGSGLGRFKNLLRSLTAGELANGAHNEVLRHLVELGLVGLALYLGIYAVAIARVVQIRALGAAIGTDHYVKLRLGVGLLTYTFIVNLFLAGGGVSMFFIIVSLGLIYAVPLPQQARATAPQRQPGLWA